MEFTLKHNSSKVEKAQPASIGPQGEDTAEVGGISWRETGLNVGGGEDPESDDIGVVGRRLAAALGSCTSGATSPGGGSGGVVCCAFFWRHVPCHATAGSQPGRNFMQRITSPSACPFLCQIRGSLLSIAKDIMQHQQQATKSWK
jgi:hypothetical protein